MYMKDVNNDPEVVSKKDSQRQSFLKVIGCLKSAIFCCKFGARALREKN